MQNAFKVSMSHLKYRNTIHLCNSHQLILFRYVLHRYESQDIHCWNYNTIFKDFIFFKIFLFKWFIFYSFILFLNKLKNKCTFKWFFNDPSAGSPTDTLLRLLLPLDNKVQMFSTQNASLTYPSFSPDHPIGRSDGRCVQRAGT